MGKCKIILVLVFSVSSLFAQDISGDSLLSDLSLQSEEQKLLPDRIFITQKLLWGERGLMRTTGISPLNVDQRQKELKIRRTMLKLHQAAGFITLAGMIAQGIVGAKLYNGSTPELRNLHSNLAGFVNSSYATTALLSFTAPPPLVNRRGISSIKIHKALAMVHLTGMIATNILAGYSEDNPKMRPYHRAVAYGTFVVFGAAVIVIKF